MYRGLNLNFPEEDVEAVAAHYVEVEAGAHRVRPPGRRCSVRKNCRTHQLKEYHTAGKSKRDEKVLS